jgi:lipoic acid synthetase
MLLGSRAHRHCTFCAVGKGLAGNARPGGTARLAEAIERLGLRHVVLTTVTRDDLPDGGAAHFAAVSDAIRRRIPENTPAIEVLISDLQGNWDALQTIIDARPQVINHNVETVPRLYPEVRPEADFARSVALLARVRAKAPIS